jgi:hypothetical protein
MKRIPYIVTIHETTTYIRKSNGQLCKKNLDIATLTLYNITILIR